MHHHNKKQGLSGNEKVLFTDKENWPLKWVREVMSLCKSNRLKTATVACFFASSIPERLLWGLL